MERRLAACATLLPGARSFYIWKGELQDDTEILVLIKTAAPVEEVAAAVSGLHPYELPEIVAIPPSFVEPHYARWVVEGSTASG